ncbi:MAG TPA: hypothetical protein VJS69_01335 [Candidatus Krumholzibacteria bacterium]|nr:hypothetical protein [Candidatus Krumholzibacteria bacterium]
MKPRHSVLFLALLALPVVAGGDRLQNGPAAPTPTRANDGQTPAFAAGQILILDSKGKFDYAAQASDVQTVLGDAVSQSSEGLVQEKIKVPGGGYMVNLQGRFQNAMTMTVDANGNVVSAPCVPSAQVPAKKVK